MHNRFSNIDKYKYPFKPNIIFNNPPTIYEHKYTQIPIMPKSILAIKILVPGLGELVTVARPAATAGWEAGGFGFTIQPANGLAEDTVTGGKGCNDKEGRIKVYKLVYSY